MTTTTTNVVPVRGLDDLNDTAAENHRLDFHSNAARLTPEMDGVGSHSRKDSLKASRVRIWEVILLTSFNFPYGLICGTMGLFVLPAEALLLYPNTQSVTLGLSLLIVGVSQLICPLAGRISDSWIAPTVFGKRSPFLFWGCAVGATSTLAMWCFSLLKLGVVYYFFLFSGMLSLNIIYSVQCGLVPDLVDEDTQGRTSGVVAVHTVAGSGLGFALMIATTSWDFHLVYPLYILMIVLTTILSSYSALRLQSRLSTPLRPNVPSRSSVFKIDVGRSEIEFMDLSKRQDEHGDFDGEDETFTVSSRESKEAIEFRPRPAKNIRARKHSSEETSVVSPTLGSPTRSTETSLELHMVSQESGMIEISERRPTLLGRPSPGLSPMPDTSPPEYEDLSPGFSQLANLSWRDLLRSYTIDTSESLDFFWVFMGRTFYYIGVSVQAFILFFLRDVVGTHDESERRMQIGCIALVAQGTAASIAYPMGKLSDSPKIGKKLLIYVACGCMSLVYVGFLVSPLFGPWAFAFVLATSTLYGAGNGCFLSVDYALALATLPNKKQAAQALGIWGVSAFIGSAIGPLLWGALIQFFGGNSESGGLGGLLGAPAAESAKAAAGISGEKSYSYTGYEAMLLGGIVATCCAGIMIRFVQKPNAQDDDSQPLSSAHSSELVQQQSRP